MSGRVLVTGAQGLVGFEVVRELLARGTEVVAVDRFTEAGREELERAAGDALGALEPLSIDLSRAPLPEALGAELSAVVHLAATVGVAEVEARPYAALRNNVLSTLHLLDRFGLDACATFLFASSSEVYAGGVSTGATPLPTPEDVPLVVDGVERPRWSYAASKIAGEAAVFGAARAGNFRPLVARLHNVYGPRMKPTHVVPALVQRCRRREDPFDLYGPEQTRSFMHVRDAAAALVHLLERTECRGVYHVGSEEEVRIGDLAERLFALADFRPTVRPLPAPDGSVGRRIPDTTRLRSTGFEAQVALDEGLAECWRSAGG